MLPAAVDLVHRLLEGMGHLVESLPFPGCPQALVVAVLFNLDCLLCQQVIGPAAHDLLGDVPLAARGVNGDHTPLQLLEFQGFRNRRDLFGMGCRVSLS